ncbi:MAG: hypothetical protein OXG82_01510 [Gammaproteobacteria bacterium]|nr:hypothetical protein [Gammaproteobacteria bacterium]
MNDNRDNQHESIEEQIERLQIDKIRLETQLIEATMRRDRVCLVLDTVKWTVIAAAMVFAFIAADRLDWLYDRSLRGSARRTCSSLAVTTAGCRALSPRHASDPIGRAVQWNRACTIRYRDNGSRRRIGLMSSSTTEPRRRPAPAPASGLPTEAAIAPSSPTGMSSTWPTETENTFRRAIGYRV